MKASAGLDRYYQPARVASPRRPEQQGRDRREPKSSALVSTSRVEKSELLSSSSVEVADIGSSCEGAEHFSIGDAEAGENPVNQQNLREVVQSLELAASAIRQAVDQASGKLDVEEAAACVRSSKALAMPLLSEPCGSPQGCGSNIGAHMSMHRPAKKLTADTGGVGSDEGDIAARLSRENEMLRGALDDALRRLVDVEGEQENFRCEGVFDLVNSLCREAAATEFIASPEGMIEQSNKVEE